MLNWPEFHLSIKAYGNRGQFRTTGLVNVLKKIGNTPYLK